MLEKYLKLLQNQVEKLKSDDFDLDAWKSSATSILSRIFGSGDPRIKQIDNLKIDYGSWALRDAKASYNPLETCKKKGREIIETSIYELENFGLPGEEGEGESADQNILIQVLEDELKGSQLKEIKKIIASDSKPDQKIKTLKNKLDSFNKDTNTSILASILVKKDLKFS